MSDLPHIHPGTPGTSNFTLHEQNRNSWNAVTEAHNSHKGDQASFFRNGGSNLYREELELLGDVRGLDMVHLQCNCGQNTLSLANLGVRAVTGVDISDNAIDFAQKLALDANIASATFVRQDVYDWLDAAARHGDDCRFDIAFSSYGAICWLSELHAWARGVAGVLKPGGKLVLVDYHPVAAIFDEQLQRRYDYFANGNVMTWQSGISDYVAQTGGPLPYGEFQAGVQDFRNPHPAHEFMWGVGDIIGAVLEAGLTVTTFREFPYANGFAPFKGMRDLGDGRFALPEGMPDLPLMYALAARNGS